MRGFLTDEITIKNSAIDALDFLEINDFPDLIFLDIQMPKMDGFGFLDNFLNFPKEKKEKCKIIMLSSSMDPNDINRAKKHPYVIDYLNKPLSEESLNEVLYKLKFG